MRLQNFLNENFQFANAKDKDYPAKKNSDVIFFNPNDEYKIRGKAHTLASHAIKHLKDIKPNEYLDIINDAIKYIKNTDYTLSTNTLTTNTVINTLDRINDKIYFKEQLTKEEEVLKEYVSKIENIYRSVAGEFIKNSITPEHLKKNAQIFTINKTIQFKVLERGTINPSNHYLNFKTLMFAVERNDKLRSFYPLKDKKEVLRKYRKNKILSDKMNNLIYG